MALLAILSLLPFLFLGLLGVKRNNQRERDRNRKTYRLSFPSDLDPERVAAWLRSISGTLRGGWSLSGQPTITFELWATHKGIAHRLKVPWQHADYIIGQLRSLVPGIRVTPEDEWFKYDWTAAVEVGISQSSRQLRIYNASDTASSILASVQALSDGEAVVVQWVATPSRPRHLPQPGAPSHRLTQAVADKDELQDRRQKAAEPNVMAVLRVGAKANTKIRADHLIYRVRSALASAHSPAARFTKRMASRREIQKRIDTASGSLAFPAQLSVSELTALIAWPIGNPFVAGLPQSLSRHLPATELVPREGRVIGRSNFPGGERPLAVSFEDSRKHMHIIGPTGTGKTSLLANMLKQDIEAEHGLVLVESKGDLFNLALDYIPPDRFKDVIVMDVNDTTRPIGFNILNQGDPKIVIDELTNLFEYLYQTNSVWTKEVLYHGLRTLTTDPKLSFIDLAPLLLPNQEDYEWRSALIRSLKDQELKNFWQRFDNQPKAAQDRIVQPVMDRIWQLNARPEIRNIIGQSTSSFQMKDVIEQNKILLVNLSGLAGDTASLTGTLIINSLWNAVKTSRGKNLNYLYLDEFQSFLRLPVDPEDMLAKARSFGLGMVLAHQHLGQLPQELRQAVLANARSKVVFQTSSADAQVMAREFGSSVTSDDFMHLGKFEAVARVATGEGVSQPFSLATLEPSRGYGRGKQVRYQSRETYGRQVSDIEREIIQRRTPDVPNNKPKPRISEWGREKGAHQDDVPPDGEF